MPYVCRKKFMKNTTLRLFIYAFSLAISTVSNAQINFEPAYYITNSNSKIEGFIQNIDWLDNPTEIKFKSSEQSESTTFTVDDIKEFGIVDGVVYKRYDVSIDKSSDSNDRLSEERAPVFENETLLLKKIIEGEASLYYYSGFGVKRFFYTLDDTPIKPLVYKRFRNSATEIGVNELYKQELKTYLTCSTISDSNYKNLKYKISPLLNFFKLYNECKGSASTVFNQESQKFSGESNFKLRAKVGARSNSFSFTSNNSNTVTDFPNKIGVQLGLEGEFIFNFNRNKWSALVEATYFGYTDEIMGSGSGFNQTFEIDYSAIEFSLGARHSFFFNENSRAFVTLNYILPININQSLTRSISSDFDEFTTLSNVALGAGVEYKKISAEFKYGFDRSLINGLDTKYSNISLTVGYLIF